MRTAIVSDKAPWPRGSHSPAIIAGAPTVYVSAQGTVARPHQLRQRAVAAFPTRVIRQLLEQRSPFGQPPQHHRRRELRQHGQRETSMRGVAARGGVGGRRHTACVFLAAGCFGSMKYPTGTGSG